MKRNLGGERDLDHIIHAALRGMDRACLEYGVRAGLIFCLAREFSLELNEILVKKAVKYRARGVVGIDLAGPEMHTLELGDDVEGYRDLFARARAAGLGTTVHTGETAHTAAPGVLAVLEKLKPVAHRPRHRRRRAARRRCASWSRRAPCSRSARARTCARTRSPTWRSWARRCARSSDAGVRFTINTDGPYLLNTHLRHEYELLLDAGSSPTRRSSARSPSRAPRRFIRCTGARA